MIYGQFNGVWQFGGKYLHAFNYFRIINKKIVIVSYLRELLERTFFVHNDGLKTFRLHDTVNSFISREALFSYTTWIEDELFKRSKLCR